MCKWATNTQTLTNKRMNMEEEGMIGLDWNNVWHLEVAQPLGEAWYCGVGLGPTQYLLNLDTMKVVKCASTLQELWGLQGWAEWKLQETLLNAPFVVMQGPFAIILDQQEEEGRNFTCHVKKLGRPV